MAAFGAVTILMDTLHRHFLQPTPLFPLRNKTTVRLLYKHLSSLQTSLEQADFDFNLGEYDEAIKGLEAQLRDVPIELREALHTMDFNSVIDNLSQQSSKQEKLSQLWEWVVSVKPP
nr:putative disease resistance RPP13-like protein 3 [Ipomoea batatas]